MSDAPRRVRARVVVVGRVQGVFYRDSTRRTARQLGVTGWVRNRADGSVEAYFVGSPADVEKMIAKCRVGPPAAHVDDVVRETQKTEPLEDLGATEFRQLPTA